MKVVLKKFSVPVLLVIACFICFYQLSCTQDKCKATVCAYGGMCKEGVCTCLPGYAGANCDSISKNNFLGTWQVNETGSVTLPNSYTVSIQSDTPANGVVIVNFYNYFRPHMVKGVINHDTITIPNQQMYGKVIFGTGYIVPTANFGRYGAIYLKYEVIDTASALVNDFGYYPYVDHSNASVWSR